MERDEELEQLMSDHGIDVVHKSIEMHAGLLVSKGNVKIAFVDPSICRKRRSAILAEEYGHDQTSVGDTVRIDDTVRIRRAEDRALRKAIEITVCPEDIMAAIKSGVRNWYELSNHLELSETFLRKAVDIWKRTIGPCYWHDNQLLWFDPLELYD